MNSMDNTALEQFSSIFKHFQVDKGEYPSMEPESSNVDLHLSKKKMKKAQRLTFDELKQLVKKPESVEWWDTTAADPKLLVSLKSYRNTVPVPSHWNQKRKYLQGKRRIEKPPFELPGKHLSNHFYMVFIFYSRFYQGHWYYGNTRRSERKRKSCTPKPQITPQNG
jgi:hypothetical protein